MSESKTTPPPLPVEPLAYFDRNGESWGPVVVGVCWMLILLYGLRCLYWLVQVVAYLFTAQQRMFRPSQARMNLIWVNLIDAVVSGVATGLAIGCLRFKESARATLVLTLAALVAIGPITHVLEAVFSVRLTVLLRDPVYALEYAARYLIIAAQSVVVPLIAARLLDRRESRSLFR